MPGDTDPHEHDDEGASDRRGPDGKEPAVPENAGSGKEFATGQSETAERQHDPDRTGGEGSGKQFSRGQSPVTEHPDPSAPHEAPKGSGQQFSRGQSPHAEDWTEDDVPASGKHFSKDRTGEEDPPGDDPPGSTTDGSTTDGSTTDEDRPGGSGRA